MNKYIWSFSIALLGSAGVQSLSAQSTMTAIHLAQTEEYQGSARYQSLGGAMGAVGADYSSVRQNPAGIALYRSSAKMSLTLGHNRLSFNPRWQGESLTKEVNRNILDNFSYISSLGFEGADWGFSGGFSIHNGGRFYNELDAHTTNTDGRSGSLADYAAIRINQEQDPRNLINDYDFRKRDAYKLGVPWIGVLGYNTGWVATKTPSTGGRYESNFVYTKDGQTVKANPLDAGLLIKETGGIREYEASFGARYQNWLFMGVNLTFSSLEYNLITSYQESFGSGDGLLLNNKMSISGTGGRVGLGLIVEPVSGLRLGASMYTPTAYSLKYDHSTFAQGTHNAEELKDQTPDGNAGVFRLYTPWRFGLSGAYVLGHRAILSADYEYSTLGKTRLKADPDDNTRDDEIFDFDNQEIQNSFGDKQTLRTGLELMLTSRLALRGGYRQTTFSSGLDEERASREALVMGALPHYSVPRSVESLSAGIGYRISPDWTLDIAYSLTTNKSRVFAFPSPIDEIDRLATPRVTNPREVRLLGFEAIDYKQTNHKVALTISYRL